MSFRYAGLFSGVGMLELACEHLGGEPVFCCEADPFCQRVLRRRFPGVPLIEDVRKVRGQEWEADALVFGFPCQGVSSAGKGLGLADARSGLWSEGFRVLSELRPKVALIENVALLRSRGLDQVLCDLHSIGYHAEWDIIPAAAVGAPHLRERIWIVARPRELAEVPVYGNPVGSFSMTGKLPRAGRMDAEGLHELVPLAPRKTKRKDGWSYWTGVNLFTGAESRLLWPSSSSSRDYKDTGDLNCVPENSLLPRRVFHVENGGLSLPAPLLPTPNANGNGNSPENHMAKKTLKCGGPRFTITDLEVIARNDFRQANGVLWGTPNAHPRTHTPRQVHHGEQLANQIAEVETGARLWPTTTTTTDALGARNETAARPNGNGRHHSGRTLTDAMVLEGHLEIIGDENGNRVSSGIQGTIDLGSGRDGIIEVVASRGIGESLGLSSASVSEPSRRCWPTPSAAAAAQGPGRSGRKGGDNLVTKINGSLNPTWVEHMMAIPLYWTDPDFHTDFTTQTPWWYEPENVPRIATGIPHRANRLRAIGNAVVWPCAYYALARAIAATPAVLRQELSLAA